MIRARLSLTGRLAVPEPQRRKGKRAKLRWRVRAPLQRKVVRVPQPRRRQKGLPLKKPPQRPRQQRGHRPRRLQQSRPRQKRLQQRAPLRPPLPRRPQRMLQLTPLQRPLQRPPKKPPPLRPPLPRARSPRLLKVKLRPPWKSLRKMDCLPLAGETAAATGGEGVCVTCRCLLWNLASTVTLRVQPKCIFSYLLNSGSEFCCLATYCDPQLNQVNARVSDTNYSSTYINSVSKYWCVRTSFRIRGSSSSNSHIALLPFELRVSGLTVNIYINALISIINLYY